METQSNVFPILNDQDRILNHNNKPTLKINNKNFEGICRCCVFNTGNINMFEAAYEDVLISDIVRYCTSISLASADNLPKSICYNCVKILINAYIFIKKFHEMQQHICIMENILFNKKNKDKVDNDSTMSSNVSEKPNVEEFSPLRGAIKEKSYDSSRNTAFQTNETKKSGIISVRDFANSRESDSIDLTEENGLKKLLDSNTEMKYVDLDIKEEPLNDPLFISTDNSTIEEIDLTSENDEETLRTESKLIQCVKGTTNIIKSETGTSSINKWSFVDVQHEKGCTTNSNILDCKPNNVQTNSSLSLEVLLQKIRQVVSKPKSIHETLIPPNVECLDKVDRTEIIENPIEYVEEVMETDQIHKESQIDSAVNSEPELFDTTLKKGIASALEVYQNSENTKEIDALKEAPEADDKEYTSTAPDAETLYPLNSDFLQETLRKFISVKRYQSTIEGRTLQYKLFSIGNNVDETNSTQNDTQTIDLTASESVLRFIEDFQKKKLINNQLVAAGDKLENEETSDIKQQEPKELDTALFLCVEDRSPFSDPDVSNNDNESWTVNVPPPNAYLCFECGAPFDYYKDLGRHCKATGHPIMPRFSCSICNKGFKRKNQVKNHMQCHSEEQPYQCHLCGVRFSYRPNLKRHLNIHKGIKKFVCEKCGKGFAQKNQLQTHSAVHASGNTGGKFLCNICGKLSLTSSMLQYHMKNHEASTTKVPCDLCNKSYKPGQTLHFHRCLVDKPRQFEEQQVPFKCPTCSKILSSLIAMRTHMLIHMGVKPFQCHICQARFRQQPHLKSHMNIHLDARPYKCKYCFKSFRHNTTLAVHTRTHTGERPYVCDVCNKGFYHLSSMKKHKQIHLKLLARNRVETVPDSECRNSE